MKRLVMALVAAGLLIATSASGTVATTTKIDVTGTAMVNHVINPGTVTQVGSVLSVRGLVQAEDGVWSNPYLTGPAINIINFDLDLATGRGEMWGSGHHDVPAVAGGGWDCMFHAVFVDGAYAGKGVCHGTGTLHRWQWRADMKQIVGGTGFTGYFFQPGH